MCVPASYDDLLRPQAASMEAQFSPADVSIITSSGQCFPAHSAVLASMSPVLEKMLNMPRKGGSLGREIRIPGVSNQALLEFLLFLYAAASGVRPATVARHAVPLLALSHAYRVGWLKWRSEEALGGRVPPEDAVDIMKFARVCDAPRLFLRCLMVAAENFGRVQRSEGWRLVRSHEPQLELEVLKFLHEAEQRRRRWRNEREDHEVFRQLGEAMVCLEHIYTEGCTDVGPHDSRPPRRNSEPCTSFRTCKALQLLIRHFAACAKKASAASGGGCIHCRRMRQLFRLHSSLCNTEDGSCKVPLCRQFKEVAAGEEAKEKGKGEDATWRLLVRKVKVARVMSTLASRKMPKQLLKAWERYRRAK